MYRIFLTALLVSCVLCFAQQPTYDLLITGGRVIDGSGNPWFYADVAISQGKVAALLRPGAAAARRILDARGLYVVPGFIDLHSHADEGLASPPTNANPNMIAQGVSTVVVNQDGRSPWPISRQKATYQEQGIGNNAVLMAGHGAVRTMAMKGDARRAATPDEIAEMKSLLRQAMEQGASGLSAGLEYAPGRWSDTEELIELVRVLAPYRGFYIAHQRSEGRDPMWKSLSDPSPAVDLLQAVGETIEIGEKTGVTVVASHLKVKGARFWGTSQAAVRLILEARGRGVAVYADQYPYPTSGSDGNTVLIPDWALADFAGKMADPPTREKVRKDVEHEIDRRGGADNIIVYEAPNPEYVEKSLAAIAALRREHPIDTVIWFQLNGLKRAGGARMRGFSISEPDIEYIMKQEFTATSSDAGALQPGEGIPHPRFYGTFPRKIRRYVFDRKVITLPFAIRSMTSLPAQIIGLRDRGLLKENFWADIVIFDPTKIADRATYVSPHQHAAGIPYVLVNGSLVVDGGKITGTLPGKVLSP